MFGTLHIGASTDDTHYKAHTDRVSELCGNLAVPPACDTCRARKVRCDGNREGCWKCQQTGTICKFSGPQGRRKARHMRAGSMHNSPRSNSKPSRNSQPRQVSENGVPNQPTAVSDKADEVSASGDDHQMLLGSKDSLSQESGSLAGHIRGASCSSAVDDVDLDLAAFDSLEQPLWDFVDSPPPAFSDHSDAFTWQIPNPSSDPDTVESFQSLDAGLSIERFVEPQSESITFATTPHRSPSTDRHRKRTHSPRRRSTFASTQYLPTPGNSSTGSQHGRNGKQSCSCSANILILLDEPYQSPHAPSSETIDVTMATHQRLLDSSYAMLDCGHCASLADHMMLLAFACRRAVVLLERSMLKLSSSQRTETRSLRYSRMDDDNSSQSSMPEPELGALPRLQFGKLELDAFEARAEIARYFLRTQLRSTTSLVHRLQGHAEKTLRSAQLGMLAEARVKLQALARQLARTPAY